jgi:hypothetical protein
MPVNFISEKISQATLFLHRKKPITFSLIIAYALGIVFLHDPLVNISVKVMNDMGLAAYNVMVSILAFTVFAAVASFVAISIIRPENNRNLKILLSAGILAAIMLHYIFLLEMNIEIVHAFAYGGLVYLIYAYTLRYGAAIVWAVPVMLFDEWYQYILLYPHYVEYWELNDVVLDMLGASLILILLFVSNQPHKNSKPYFTRPEFILGGSMVVLFIVATASCIFALHISEVCHHTVFVMNKMETAITGWHIHGFTQKKYYILSPAQSIVLISAISFAFIGLDSCLSKKM